MPRRKKIEYVDASALPIVKHEGRRIKREVVCIDLDDEGQIENTVKREVKREVKAEPRDEKKKSKKSKVKRERPDDRERSRSKGKEKRQGDEKERRKRSPSRSRRKRSESSSSSSSESDLSEEAMYTRLRPYTKVQLVNLVRKAELNGMSGQVLHPSVAVCPCPPGCMLVRLDTGREIACKPKNLVPLQSFHVGPHQAPQSQDARLKQVLKMIKTSNITIDHATADVTTATTQSVSILGGGGSLGGVGHVL